MSGTTDSVDVKFTFFPFEEKTCKTLNSKDVQELLMKWSMKGRITVQYFSYDSLFQSYQKDDFALLFLQCPTVISSLSVLSESNTWCPVGFEAAKIEVKPVQCSITSMTFFDRLFNEGIVRENGSIVKCLDEFYEDFQISDELRKVLLVEDSDLYDIFSEDDRSEFVFILLKHLCLGGAVCQYEDDIKPYLDTVKSLYKELISVQKDSKTQELSVTSLVYRLQAWDKDGYQYYPCDKEHEQNFAYLIVDPIKRHVAVLYHQFGGGVFT
ncbi:cilia- and flagella-associated protein 300-like isoform X1 [Asterias rubens]|uniref:cilia- and flagella-associated protein 300-like isoform X1 n=2 Tax=Asterias rubens TaxID=7604 RepID=UPI00145586A9|nr:cilia- and flagella-associated protein 300-like isoform X1 [Asterias rubens]